MGVFVRVQKDTKPAESFGGAKAGDSRVVFAIQYRPNPQWINFLPAVERMGYALPVAEQLAGAAGKTFWGT